MTKPLTERTRTYYIFDGRWPSDRAVCLCVAHTLEEAIIDAKGQAMFDPVIVIKGPDGFLEDKPIWKLNP